MTEHDQQENQPSPSPALPLTHSQGFNSLDLPEKIMDGIRDAGFVEMTPVQSRSLPVALEGKDVCAQAQTGTGKTAAFLITIFTGSSEPDPCQSKRPP